MTIQPWLEDGSASQALQLFVQLAGVSSRLGAKNTSTTPENRVFDITGTSCTGTFLAFDFSSRANDFTPFLRLVCTLTLIGQVLLHSQINGMFIGFYFKYIGRQLNFSTRLFALNT